MTPTPMPGPGHDPSGRVHEWPVWEVFVRPAGGLSHQHVGSVHAPDAPMALRSARDVYTRRNEGVSIWVAPGAAVVAAGGGEADPSFDPDGDRAYPHPTFRAGTAKGAADGAG